MAGEWISCANGQVVEEHWLGPTADGQLVASSLTRGPGDRAEWEFLRVTRTPTGASYFASPGGRPPVEFKLVEQGPRRAVFENPALPFPRRILYWRDGENLHARIEGQLKGAPASEEWTWGPKHGFGCSAAAR
jgi:hypothetical protein